MVIKEKCGKISLAEKTEKIVDVLKLEWHETGKRIMHRITELGTPVHMRFLKENPNLSQGDVLYEDEKKIIAVDILPCEVIAIYPESGRQTAGFCYEVGNRHAPLFYDEDAFLIPFDAPLFDWLNKNGYAAKKENRKLLHPLRTSVSPHGYSDNRTSLFDKIMRVTESLANAEK